MRAVAVQICQIGHVLNAHHRGDRVGADHDSVDRQRFVITDLAVFVLVEVGDHVGLETCVLEDDVLVALVDLALERRDAV